MRREKRSGLARTPQGVGGVRGLGNDGLAVVLGDERFGFLEVAGIVYAEVNAGFDHAVDFLEIKSVFEEVGHLLPFAVVGLFGGAEPYVDPDGGFSAEVAGAVAEAAIGGSLERGPAGDADEGDEGRAAFRGSTSLGRRKGVHPAFLGAGRGHGLKPFLPRTFEQFNEKGAPRQGPGRRWRLCAPKTMPGPVWRPGVPRSRPRVPGCSSRVRRW